MITVLFFNDTKTYVMRAEQKTSGFLIHKMASYDDLTQTLRNADVDTLSNALSNIAHDLDSEHDTWHIILPASLTLSKLELTSMLSDDTEEIIDVVLGCLDQQLDKNEYIPFIIQSSPRNIDDRLFFYTFAYTEKQTINTLVESFRAADLDLLYVEPAPASAIRYIKNAYDLNNLDLEVVFRSPGQASLVTNKYGTVVMKNELGNSTDYQDEFSNISMLVNLRNEKFRSYKASRQIFITSDQGLDTYLSGLDLDVVDMPLLEDFTFLGDDPIPEYAYPIFCGGLLLKNKKPKRWWLNAVKQLFK